MTEKSMIMNRKRNRKQCMVKRYSCLFTAILITFLILAVSLSICFTVNAHAGDRIIMTHGETLD